MWLRKFENRTTMKLRVIVCVGVYARASVNSKIRISANGTFMITRHKYHLLVLRAQKQAESARISELRVTKLTDLCNRGLAHTGVYRVARRNPCQDKCEKKHRSTVD